MHLKNVVMTMFAINLPLIEKSIMCLARSVMRKDDSVPFTAKLPDAVTFHGCRGNMPNICIGIYINLWDLGGARKTGQG